MSIRTRLRRMGLAVLVGSLWMGLVAAQAKNRQETLTLHAGGDQEIRMYSAFHIEADCKAAGPIAVVAIKPPAHGTFTSREIKTFPSYDDKNAYAKCNAARVPTMAAYYQAKPGFKGPDQMEFAFIFNDGTIWRFTAKVTVW